MTQEKGTGTPVGWSRLRKGLIKVWKQGLSCLGGKYPRQRKPQKPWEVGTSLTPSKNSKKRAGQLGPGSKGIGQQGSQGVSDGQFRQGFEGHCHFTRLWLLFWVTCAAMEGFGAEGHDRELIIL